MAAMILFPAIDLKDGKCVRLVQGDMGSATTFNDDPAAQAQIFEAQGFPWLHLVDLNGAIEGRSVNAHAVEAILSRVSVPVQLGGGVRDRAAIERWLDKRVTRVILGTAALRNPELVREAASAHRGRIAVALDARNGLVAVEGWAQDTTLSAIELAKRMEGAGVAALIYTDIARDGTGAGPNIAETVSLAQSVNLPIIASGGVGGIADIEALISARAACPNISGVIIGRALYDGRVDAKAALALVQAHG
jgi:phosphoribosylformimino-5-aminoimidazole carboxamide ribotide isomerase